MIVLIVICIVAFINQTSCLDREFTRLTPKHGTNTGDSMNSFVCPGNGAIIGIEFYVDTYIQGLKFICSSADGIRAYGIYGEIKGSRGELFCPPGQYISSFYGRSGEFISDLGIFCRTITADLKGNGTDFLNMAQGSHQTLWPKFNDWAYSNGARPIGANIWTSDQVEAIQLVYTNAPVEMCTVNCTKYQEEFTPFYGTLSEKEAIFGCPSDGAVTAVTTKVSSGRLRTIQFVCTSGVGTVTMPALGQDLGTSTLGVTTVKCPPGTIVGSFHGTHLDTIHSLGVRCVEIGETGESPKYDAQGGSGTVFDGVNYSSKGWRPVLFRIYYGPSGINAMQLKYANSAVSTNCKVTKIEVIDETVQAVSDGSEMIGIATAVSCVNGTQVLKLDESRDVTEDVSITVSDGGDIHFATELSVTSTAGFEMFGNKVEVSVGLSQSVGGSKQWSSSKANSKSTSTGQVAGTEITYKSPGACVIIGYVERYKLDRDNVNVKLKYTCETGEMAHELGVIKIKSTTYGLAYFEDYQMRINSESQCTSETRTCVKNIKANQVLHDSSTLVEQFGACFASGVGELNRKR